MANKLFDIDQKLINEWRELGFYYDRDEKPLVNQWTFFGSRKGLQNFVTLLDEYISNPRNNTLSEHEHYGPYCYLKIMTWDKAVITPDYIAGTIEDLKILRDLLSAKLSNAKPGETFFIDAEYGIENTAAGKFIVMTDDFDPVSMDV